MGWPGACNCPLFSAAAVALLISQLSGGGESAKPLADRLYRETEGNPFYLIETVKALFEAGAIRVEAGTWQADYVALGRGRLPLHRQASARRSRHGWGA